MFKITFYPEKKSIEVEKSTTILSAAQAVGIYINSVCGGDSICGKCKVIVLNGLVSTEPTTLLTRHEIQRGYVLACTASVNSDLDVDIPLESRQEETQILLGDKKEALYSPVHSIARLVEEEEKVKFELAAISSKMFLKLPKPTLKDNISDLQRIYREIRREKDIPIMQTGLAVVKQIAKILRESKWEVTVTLGERNGTTEVVQVEPGDTTKSDYGIAVDVGTTTVVAHLLNLNTGETLGAKGTYNKQITYGADVISRIIYATEKGGLEKLKEAVVGNINNLISSLVTENKIKLSDCLCISVAGNTTMVHLLTGIDPTYIRQEPYVPTANFLPVIRASEVGVKINPRGILAIVPGVASYVGGDITAGVLASGMAEKDEISIFIDMGTNGEIVLGNKDWLCCCACSAGPAFEGSGIKCGMRARIGAIQSFKIDRNFEVSYSVIGTVKPHGICGSGLIDLIGELLKNKIIDRTGKINKDLKTDRLRISENGTEFVLVQDSDTMDNEDIIITDTDIENLVCAKAAVYAGASVLIKHLNLTFNDIKNYYIGGAFGTHLDIEKSIFFGLLPDLPMEKFHFLGNSSVTGSRQFLLSEEARNKANLIAQKMTSFELSIDPSFMDEYIAAKFLPHTDLSKFPSYSVK